MSGIAPGEISVVVQGPIVGGPGAPDGERLTRRALESVRRHLPGAEIVLSTWKGADVSGLPFDVLVQGDDPGAVRFDAHGPGATPLLYTGNRQIISTRDGLRAATRAYAMKLRSDMLLTGTAFLGLFHRYPARSPRWRILRDRALASTYYARNPTRRLKYLFHPGDWWFFGWREDLLDIWDIPLAGPEIPRWYETRPTPDNHAEPGALFRYTVEQYVWSSFLRKHGPVPFEHKTDWQPGAAELSELTIANNLVLAEPEQLDIRFVKYRVPRADWQTLYTRGDWERLYRRYCDPDFRPVRDWLHLAKTAYGGYVASAALVSSPSSSPVGSQITTRWRSRFPRSFDAARSAYVSGLTMMSKALRR